MRTAQPELPIDVEKQVGGVEPTYTATGADPASRCGYGAQMLRATLSASRHDCARMSPCAQSMSWGERKWQLSGIVPSCARF